MSDGEADTIVRLRGMPWSSTAEDVVSFLGSEVHVMSEYRRAQLLFSPPTRRML